MSIEALGWAWVRRGTADQAQLVWVIKRDGVRVRYEAPNSWALKAGDARAGWTKPTETRPEKFENVAGAEDGDKIEQIVAAIGHPPSTRKVAV